MDKVDVDDLGPFEWVEVGLDEQEQEAYQSVKIMVSGRYAVYVRPDTPTGWDVGEDQLLVTHLSIKRHDREAIHDWRDFQLIKTTLCGKEAEAIEIYPAESRLVDTSNQYHLWVFPEGLMLPVGFTDGRLVTNHALGKAKQRPHEILPDDIISEEEFDRRAREFIRDHGLDEKEVMGE
jgi:hypothetical protein